MRVVPLHRTMRSILPLASKIIWVSTGVEVDRAAARALAEQRLEERVERLDVRHQRPIGPGDRPPSQDHLVHAGVREARVGVDDAV
jgi:hypothetical protein